MILALVVPALGRAVAAGIAAAFPLAAGRLVGLDLGLRLDPDAVEIFGVQIHGSDYYLPVRGRQEADRLWGMI